MIDLRKCYHVMVGDPESVIVHLVGCGGTGSFLALHLARMAYDVGRDGTAPLRLVFHDGDVVEGGNVGRQNFAPGEVGENKALALARRYSLAFGLEIEARPAMFDEKKVTLLRHLDRREMVVVVGAVDRPEARIAMHRTVASQGGRIWWLDAGNHENSGQVLLGNREDLRAPAISPLGWCEGLPLPSVASPELVGNGERRTANGEGLGCAEMMALGAQSLMINQAMAGWAATMLARLVLSRDLDFWQVWVDLASGSARGVGIFAQEESQPTVDKDGGHGV